MEGYAAKPFRLNHVPPVPFISHYGIYEAHYKLN